MLGILMFCSLVLGQRVLELRGLGEGALDLALCIGASAIGFIWPIGAVVGVLGSNMIGESSAPLGASLSLWLRTALALRLAFDVSSRRIPLSRITSSTYRYWLPFAAVVLLAYLVSGGNAGIGWLLKFMLTVVFVAGCAAYVQGLDSLLMLQTGLVATGLVSAVWEILHVVSGGWRGGVLEVNPNYGAMYMCTAYFLALGLLTRRGPLRILSIAAVVGIPLGIIVSGSRGGTLVMLFGTAAYLMLFRKSAGRFLRVAGPLIIALLLTTTLLPGFIENSRFVQTFRNLLGGSTIDPQTGRELDRLPLWRDSIRLWLSHPILGVGPASWFGERVIINPAAKTEAPHMYVAQILAELGTLGGIAYVYFLIRSFVAAALHLKQTARQWNEVLIGWVVAGLALAASTFSDYAYSPFLHGFMIIATSSSLLSKRRYTSGDVDTGELPGSENNEPTP